MFAPKFARRNSNLRVVAAMKPGSSTESWVSGQTLCSAWRGLWNDDMVMLCVAAPAAGGHSGGARQAGHHDWAQRYHWGEYWITAQDTIILHYLKVVLKIILFASRHISIIMY
jgi:hypothetical protein